MIPQQLLQRAAKHNRLKFLARHGEKQVRIVSREYGMYWRPKGAGYCSTASQAGVYTLADAFARSGHVGPEKGIYYEFVRTETAQA